MEDDEFKKLLIKKLDELSMKIDALIQVITITSRKESVLKGKSKADQIKLLSNLGLHRTVVAWIVGATPESVSVTMSQIKSKAKKTKRKKTEEIVGGKLTD